MKSAPKAPKPVDPSVLSDALTSSNINTAVAQQALNQTDKSGPFGSTSYQQTGTVNVDGHEVPTYSSTSQLSAPLSSLLASIEKGANTTNYEGGISTAGLPGISDPTLLNQQTADAIYNQAKSRLDPQWEQTDSQLEAQLSQRGIPPGSAAYEQARHNYDLAKNDAYTSAQNAATEGAVKDASQLYQDQLAGLQTGINTQIQQQQAPLNWLTQIMSGTSGLTNAQAPQVSVQTPDVLGAYGLNASQQQNAYNAAMNQYSSALGGLGGLAGNALMFALL